MSTMSTPELNRIKSVRVPRRMYVSKFQRLSIDLTNNPITHRGVEQMRAGVERARSRGFAVVVWVGSTRCPTCLRPWTMAYERMSTQAGGSKGRHAAEVLS